MIICGMFLIKWSHSEEKLVADHYSCSEPANRLPGRAERAREACSQATVEALAESCAHAI